MGIVVLLWTFSWWMGPLEGPQIEFIVPKGFSGAFIIVQHPTANQPKWVDGVARVDVPASRIVYVKSFEFLEEPGQRRARFEDGTVIPYESQSGIVAPEMLALRSLGKVSSGDGGPRDTTAIEYWVGKDVRRSREQEPIASGFAVLRKRAAIQLMNQGATRQEGR
jgi:hypothetical protein